MITKALLTKITCTVKHLDCYFDYFTQLERRQAVGNWIQRGKLLKCTRRDFECYVSLDLRSIFWCAGTGRGKESPVCRNRCSPRWWRTESSIRSVVLARLTNGRNVAVMKNAVLSRVCKDLLLRAGAVFGSCSFRFWISSRMNSYPNQLAVCAICAFYFTIRQFSPYFWKS